MIKAAIYARVSSDMQAEEEIPILGQIEECRKFCATKEWEVVKVYQDAGFTGRNTDRPSFVELLADAKKHLFAKIVVWKGSRIARNVQDRLATETFLGKNGVDIISMNEPDLEGSSRILMLPIMAALDEYQSYIIAEDTLRGQKMLARQGYSAGGLPPKGYRIKRTPAGLKKNGEPLFRSSWEPDPEWRDLALKAFEMLAEERSSYDIIQATHVVSDKSGLSTYFRNPCFIGERCFNVHRKVKGRVIKFDYDDPDVIKIPNAHEAIISPELFAKVGEILSKRRHNVGHMRAVSSDYILSEVLWCDTHNCQMTGSGNAERKYYICHSMRTGGRKCSNCQLLHKEDFEKYVLQALKDKFLSRQSIRKALEHYTSSTGRESKQTNETITRLQTQIAKLDTELQRFYAAIAKGIDADQLAEPITDRQQQKEALTEKLANIKVFKPSAKLELTRETVDEYRKMICEIIDTGTPEIKRKFVTTHVQKIRIAEGSITIDLIGKEPSAISSQVGIAGAGFGPATFGL